MDTQDDRVPVTLLTGFLGAGKTTLLNHLIRDPGAGRIAVIMNEFGDVGLDHDLIEESTEETILMQSGCLCCTFRGDIATTLSSLMERRKQGELSFERVVIETTGIADPGPILHTLVVDDLIAPAYRMDGVVTLADAATGPRTLESQPEAVHQIAVADLIVLTKTDLVTASECEDFEKQLEAINGTAHRVRAEHGHVPTGTLFGLSALRQGATPEDISSWLGAHSDQERGHHDHAHGNHGHHHHGDHHHGHNINSASIEVSDPIPASVFDFWLDTLITFRGPDILRLKGIVHVEGMEWPFVLHGVQHIFDAPVPLKSWSGKDTTSRVVVIARDLEKEDLKVSLEVLRLRLKETDKSTEGMMVHATEMPF